MTGHIHNRASFLLLLNSLSGAIYPLFPSSILDTYQPGGLIVQCHIFLSFNSVHGVLKERILEWFVIPVSFSSQVIGMQK